MRKMIGVTIIMILALSVCITCALAEPEDMQGQILQDFSTETISGTTFTLSESLKTHDLVLINFWATWCGPCCYEFPFLETAWKQYSDRVDVIALSVEEADTFDTLRGFAQENGLSFSIGRDQNRMFDTMGGSAIPTTLIVDKNRSVLAVEIGSKSSAEEFTQLFDRLLSEVSSASSGQTETSGHCVICFRDAGGNPISGVTVAFCNGEYTPVLTDADGRVTFDGNPKEYHVHLLEVPAGYEKPWGEMYIDGEEYDLTVTLYPC